MPNWIDGNKVEILGAIKLTDQQRPAEKQVAIRMVWEVTLEQEEVTLGGEGSDVGGLQKV